MISYLKALYVLIWYDLIQSKNERIKERNIYITIYAQEMIQIKSLPGLWTDTHTNK